MTSVDVWRDLIASAGPGRPHLVGAMEARRALGIERYGAPLRTDDGRDHALDLGEELLDGAAYAWRLGLDDLALDLLDAYGWLAWKLDRPDMTPQRQVSGGHVSEADPPPFKSAPLAREL